MPTVDFVHGDILEGGQDLTVFPASAKGSVSSTTRKKATKWLRISLPSPMNLGDISELIRVTVPDAETKYVVYAASVLNDYSNPEAIRNIAKKVGMLTRKHPDITNVEVPLLGTGAGRLSKFESAMALKEGFLETAREDARMTVFMFRMEDLEEVQRAIANPLAEKYYMIKAPTEIYDALKKYDKERNKKRTIFVIMSFEKTSLHDRILDTVRKTCERYGFKAMIAKDRYFHEMLLYNILTYIYGCDGAIAIFERIRSDAFNPNVSLEVGYLMALGKPLLLLKDTSLERLTTDLMGKLYYSFDFTQPEETIPSQIERWLEESGLLELDDSDSYPKKV